MKNRIGANRFGRGFLLLVTMMTLSHGAERVAAQEKQLGDIADDFQLVNVMTNEPVSLSDFEGSIVLLDFFFYW